METLVGKLLADLVRAGSGEAAGDTNSNSIEDIVGGIAGYDELANNTESATADADDDRDVLIGDRRGLDAHAEKDLEHAHGQGDDEDL